MDAGEAEASALGRGRQLVSTKSRSSKEPLQNERSTEVATKPVSRMKGARRVRGRQASGEEQEVLDQGSALQVTTKDRESTLSGGMWVPGRDVH